MATGAGIDAVGRHGGTPIVLPCIIRTEAALETFFGISMTDSSSDWRGVPSGVPAAWLQMLDATGSPRQGTVRHLKSLRVSPPLLTTSLAPLPTHSGHSHQTSASTISALCTTKIAGLSSKFARLGLLGILCARTKQQGLTW